MRYLVVGFGNIGHKRVAALGDRCVGTVDPIGSAVYKRVEDCTEQYDAAILSVPNEPKYALMRYFLERGKHVVVEKPLILPEGQLSGLRKVADEHGVIWQTGYNHRFEPQVGALRNLLPELGEIYNAHLFYGNGTVGNGHAYSAAQELGCHLVDLIGWLFNYHGRFSITQEKHEGGVSDTARLQSQKGEFSLDVSYVSWKNTFTIDVYGRSGSLHLDGLCKWGQSQLIHYERCFPSGPPHEVRTVMAGQDQTWKAEIETFENLAKLGINSYANDAWISQCLR